MINTGTLWPSAHLVVCEIRMRCSSNVGDGSRNKPPRADTDKEKGRQVQLHSPARWFSRQEQSYLHLLSMWTSCHWSTFSLKYHLLAKHTADAESTPSYNSQADKHVELTLRKCAVGHYIVSITKECYIQVSMCICCCLLGLSLPCYAFSIFSEQVASLRLFWRIFWTVFVVFA